jgi:hypothetical protein
MIQIAAHTGSTLKVYGRRGTMSRVFGCCRMCSENPHNTLLNLCFHITLCFLQVIANIAMVVNKPHHNCNVLPFLQQHSTIHVYPRKWAWKNGSSNTSDLPGSLSPSRTDQGLHDFTDTSLHPHLLLDPPQKLHHPSKRVEDCGHDIPGHRTERDGFRCWLLLEAVQPVKEIHQHFQSFLLTRLHRFAHLYPPLLHVLGIPELEILPLERNRIVEDEPGARFEDIRDRTPREVLIEDRG